MDLPPSGWYPDPYGAPDLLRWWDGSTWTHHTHPGVGVGEGTADTTGGAAGGGAQQAAARSAGLQATTVQPAAAASGFGQSGFGQSGFGQSGSGQSGSGQSSGGWATRDRVIGDWAGSDWPTGDQLAKTTPPKGPRTEPQPALPTTTVQPAVRPGLQPTVYQPAVTSVAPTTVQPAVQPATVQPTTVQPMTVQPTVRQSQVQPTTVQPTTVQPATAQPQVQPTTVQPTTVQPSNGWGTAGQYGGGQGATAYLGQNGGHAAGGHTAGRHAAAGYGATDAAGGGADAGGTQVLFLGGDAWQVPGAPGTPGGPSAPNRHGYQQAQRRRRRWLIGGLVVGIAVAIAVIAIVATSLSKSPGDSTPDQAASTPLASLTPSAAAPSPTPTASASATSATATPPASLLSDGQSGLSYSQLGSPWQPACPSDLNSAFNWTAGESAAAGQVNGGQTTWYGEACSGPLPAQYNYSGVADLDTTATSVAQTLQNAYYNPLSHTSQPELSQPVTVSGHPGWEIEYLINYTNASGQGATWTTEEAAVVVADTGTGNAPAVFFTSIPDSLTETNVALLVSSLQLTVVPSDSTASPTPSASGSATSSGFPTSTDSAPATDSAAASDSPTADTSGSPTPTGGSNP
jgi:hypothetical protein